jgi:hypothetical protein
MPGPTRSGEVTLATLNAIRAAYRAECERAVPGRAGRPLSRLAQLRAAAMEKRQELDNEREIRAAKRKGK